MSGCRLSRLAIALTLVGGAALMPIAATAASPAIGEDAATGVVDALGTRERVVTALKMLGPNFASGVMVEIQADPARRSQLDAIAARDPRGIDGFKQALSEEFGREFLVRYPRLRVAIAGFYRERFTSGELSVLAAFLATPAGVKFIAVQPQAMSAGSAEGQSIGQEAGIAAVPAALARAGGVVSGPSAPAIKPSTKAP